VNILLHALDRLGKKITYYALDLDRSELVRTLQLIPAGTFKNVRCVGLHGTYDDGKAWLKSSATANDKSRCILWLGSSAGNFNLRGVAEFLKEWAADALRVGKPDCMLVGLDGCKVAEKVKLAYNDPKGVSRDFTLNGLWHANSVMEKEHFVRGEWEFVGEWNAEEGRHQAYYEALKDITFDGALEGVTVKKGEKINVEYSYKFDENESHLLWEHAGLADGARWSNDAGDYCKYSPVLLTTTEFIRPDFTLKYECLIVKFRSSYALQTKIQFPARTTLAMCPESNANSVGMDGIVGGVGHCDSWYDSQGQTPH
jgi:EasF-like predicted methyltransferase